MQDRAAYISRRLIERLTSLEIAGLDEAGPIDHGFELEIRRDMVAKVLATEVGLTDETSIRRVLEALPRVIPGEQTAQRDYDELADFLRTRLSVV
jgi:hypothetical protein